jgi:hypothetical protein
LAAVAICSRTVDFDPPRRAGVVVRAPAQRESVLGQLDEVGLTERRDDGVDVELEEREEGVVRDVSAATTSSFRGDRPSRWPSRKS